LIGSSGQYEHRRFHLRYFIDQPLAFVGRKLEWIAVGRALLRQWW
jgi:hypothetical protein